MTVAIAQSPLQVIAVLPRLCRLDKSRTLRIVAQPLVELLISHGSNKPCTHKHRSTSGDFILIHLIYLVGDGNLILF